jgi:L-lactate dehydrogenase complex protein LldF
VTDHGTPGGYRRQAAATISDKPQVRDSVLEGTDRANDHRNHAYAEIDADRWRDWGRDVKTHTLTHLDRYLEEAERNLEANGVKVHWAATAADALTILRGIVREHDVKSVVKAKSMLSEELGVNEHLERLGVHVRETDLGEYIVQILGEPPSHIVAPVMHLSLDDCRRLFHKRLGTPLDGDPESLVEAARLALREEFLAADMGISGGNFLVAETGTVALIENEGNIRLSTSLPRLHVALVGIEKLIPRFEDLAGFIQLTARAATGQPIGNYVSFIQGPRKSDEVDGPEEVHVVLVDNGRTNLLADDVAWEALRCVRCGACLNICPVYRQTGGHAYGYTYSGPIGAIIAPGLLGLEEAMPLPFASSLCGACADVCPVRIPIPELLVHWRERAVEEGLTSKVEGMGLEAFTAAAAHPTLYKAAAALLRHTPWQAGGSALPILKGWMQERTAPEPSPKSFQTLWKEGIE